MGKETCTSSFDYETVSNMYSDFSNEISLFNKVQNDVQVNKG